MYRHPALKQLKEQQARFTPKDRRLEQIDRAEVLLAEIAPAKRYPYEYLCFRITGFRPEGTPALVLEGGDVRNDLRLFIEDLSATVGQKLEQAAEPVLTVDAVSRRYNVSTRTVNRWRSQGLVARRFVIEGRTKVGFLGHRASSGSSTLTTSRSSEGPGSDNLATRSGRRSSDAPAGWPRSAATTA